ncbi:ABC transporter permease [Nocardioides sp.]|uniref:ABC transporter permease n=1 Tax=Nocardioides sp. TaxID=35761 RepID=UPI0025D27662|nr:ABC transporter permease [Nocardioides sp.]
MTGLAWRSLRHRATASVATFVAVLLGTALMGSFAALAASASGPVSTADHDTLTTMGTVVGAWGAIIVLSAVVSTVGITVTQREVEIGLLRTVGATPGQASRLVRAETLLVAALGSALGAGLAWLGGAALLTLLRNTGTVADSVPYSPGLAPLATAALVVLVSLLGSGFAARRATRGSASITPSEGRPGTGRLPWWRVAAAVALFGYSAAMAVVTITVTAHDDDPYSAMATSGQLGILVAVGLGCLAPWLLRVLSPATRPALGRGAAGYLAAYNARRRSRLLSGVLAPVIVLTASGISVFMIVGTDDRTRPAGFEDDARTINLLNNVVVGMMVVFAAVVVVNTFAAVVAHRRSELRQLWLLGATPHQVEASVLAEARGVAAIGVVLGALASLVAVIPFGVARHEGVVPDGQLWLPPLVMAAAAALTLLAARSAVRRAHLPAGSLQ